MNEAHREKEDATEKRNDFIRVKRDSSKTTDGVNAKINSKESNDERNKTKRKIHDYIIHDIIREWKLR